MRQTVPSKVVLASANLGKIAEMQTTLESFGTKIVPQSKFNITEAVEDGLSFIENALIKARHACLLTGLPAIADDSGLEVDALNGAPGILSARYAEGKGDHANNVKLLQNMAGCTDRTARFQCIIVYLRHAKDPNPIIAKGTWEGQISEQPQGSNGFGYDPLFYLPELGCCAAELSALQKKTLSHRGKALQHLQQQIQLS